MTSIAEIMKEINKKYGENKISIISEGNANNFEIESFSTGCWKIDNVFGCGGLPRGRIIEMYGIESSGKSTMALFFAKTVQENGGTILWIDAECAFSSEHAKNIGVDVSKNFILCQPDCGEEALDIANKMTSTGKIDLCVVDSVAALTPKKELEGEIEKENMALQARMMGKGLRMITANLSKTKTAMIFINQVRDSMALYGPKEVTPGGKALKFYASVRIKVKKGDKILDENKDVIGNMIMIEGIKNKVGLPFRSATFPLYYKKGIDVESLAFDDAVEKELITKSGNTYSYGEIKLGVGQEKARQSLKENEQLFNEIIDKLKN